MAKEYPENSLSALVSLVTKRLIPEGYVTYNRERGRKNNKERSGKVLSLYEAEKLLRKYGAGTLRKMYPLEQEELYSEGPHSLLKAE